MIGGSSKTPKALFPGQKMRERASREQDITIRSPPAPQKKIFPSFAPACTAVDLLFNSRLNKGTAFTEQERDTFGLHGLLPPHIGTLEDQRLRRKRVLDSRDTAFGKYSNMRDLQDNDETSVLLDD